MLPSFYCKFCHFRAFPFAIANKNVKNELSVRNSREFAVILFEHILTECFFIRDTKL